MKLKNYISDLFFSTTFYLLLGSCALLFLMSFFFPFLYVVSTILTILLVLVTLADYCLLFFLPGGLMAQRQLPARLSLGDDNVITLKFANRYPFMLYCTIVDELPAQFQMRNFSLKQRINYGERKNIPYHLRPLTRGEYHFGRLLVYTCTPIRLVQRRIVAAAPAVTKVYPSFQHLKKHQLLALSDSSYNGEKKIRRSGQSLEFEKIKEYVQGDDVRNINWTATARRNTLMVNTFTDARQQQIYCVIDKGRTMKMPFEGMTLLDYSINAALALLNIVLLRQDKAGLIAFTRDKQEIVPADKRNNQFFHIQEALYRQQTEFNESDYESLQILLHRSITQRSLLLLFTNFETMSSLERQLPYLRQIARRHLLCVVFFENTLLRQIHDNHPDSVKGVYIKTIADRFDYEKKQIVKELRRHGILSILTTPSNLTVQVINKYLELKARQMV